MRRQAGRDFFFAYLGWFGAWCGAVLNMQPYALILIVTALDFLLNNPENTPFSGLGVVMGAGQALASTPHRWLASHCIAGINLGFAAKDVISI